MARPVFTTIDEYIDSCEPETQRILRELRVFIREHAPESTEKIAWAMPTFYQNGNLVHFFAYKKHIGFYPGADGIQTFIPDFEEAGYAYSKGAVQFPLDKPLPWDLIRRIVLFRVSQNTDKQSAATAAPHPRPPSL